MARTKSVSSADWMTIQDVADHFGHSYSTIYRAIREGSIPTHSVSLKRGVAHRIPRAWVESQSATFADGTEYSA